MIARMLKQAPLPWLPAGAAEIAPGVGVERGGDGGVVWVHGLATFAWDAGDEASRRLAAVQLVRLRAATQRADHAGVVLAERDLGRDCPGGLLGVLAADRLDLRGPVQAQHPARRSGSSSPPATATPSARPPRRRAGRRGCGWSGCGPGA